MKSVKRIPDKFNEFVFFKLEGEKYLLQEKAKYEEICQSYRVRAKGGRRQLSSFLVQKFVKHNHASIKLYLVGNNNMEHVVWKYAYDLSWSQHI